MSSYFYKLENQLIVTVYQIILKNNSMVKTITTFITEKNIIALLNVSNKFTRSFQLNTVKCTCNTVYCNMHKQTGNTIYH